MLIDLSKKPGPMTVVNGANTGERRPPSVDGQPPRRAEFQVIINGRPLLLTPPMLIGTDGWRLP